MSEENAVGLLVHPFYMIHSFNRGFDLKRIKRSEKKYWLNRYKEFIQHFAGTGLGLFFHSVGSGTVRDLENELADYAKRVVRRDILSISYSKRANRKFGIELASREGTSLIGAGEYVNACVPEYSRIVKHSHCPDAKLRILAKYSRTICPYTFEAIRASTEEANIGELSVHWDFDAYNPPSPARVAERWVLE